MRHKSTILKRARRVNAAGKIISKNRSRFLCFSLAAYRFESTSYSLISYAEAKVFIKHTCISGPCINYLKSILRNLHQLLVGELY